MMWLKLIKEILTVVRHIEKEYWVYSDVIEVAKMHTD